VDGDGCQANCTLTPRHDSVVAPLRPRTYTIPLGAATLMKKVKVMVTNADLYPPDTHRVQLTAANLTARVQVTAQRVRPVASLRQSPWRRGAPRPAPRSDTPGPAASGSWLAAAHCRPPRGAPR